ncbi:hypothetical protein SAMN02745114_01645, partial [Eubacterium coprostanoligenes]
GIRLSPYACDIWHSILYRKKEKISIKCKKAVEKVSEFRFLAKEDVYKYLD